MKSQRVPFVISLALLLGILVPCSTGQTQVTEVKELVRFQDFSAFDAGLSGLGINARLYTVQYITASDSGQFGGTIFARNVGNKRLGAHWVPGDPRRYGINDIYWTTDQVDESSSVPLADSSAAIDRAMNTWQGVRCSGVPLTKVPDYGLDWGYVQWQVSQGASGFPGWPADITHAGWLPAAFFDSIAPPNGSEYILGVTFTFIWTEGEIPTDIDGNRKYDVAFREIYYNDNFAWSTEGPAWYDPEVDIETIALHEVGHGLSQAHFGKMFVDASDPEPPYSISHLHFAPRAVMNAVYWDTQRELLDSDVGGHCSIWASWPR
jgi:hypothetical protein